MVAYDRGDKTGEVTITMTFDVTASMAKLRELRITVAIWDLGGTTRRALPPGIVRCGAVTDSGWGCFRPAGHDGRHDPDGYPDGLW